jgi:hypothetical protein
MSIYIVSHLRLKCPEDSGHRIMYVGPLSGKTLPDEGAMTDADLSPHIGHKNRTFCELTALHQMALRHANSPSDVIGLEHYRRRFVNGPKWLCQIIRTTQKSFLSRPISNFMRRRFELTHAQAAGLLEHCDIIVPRPARLKLSVEEHYRLYHVCDDWEKLRHVVTRRFPDYTNAFEAFSRQKTIHHFNMFVARSEFVQQYCRWLFEILDQLESEIDLSARDSFQIRVFGFLAERLLNVFLLRHSQLKVMQLPVVQLYNESVVQPAPL